MKDAEVLPDIERLAEVSAGCSAGVFAAPPFLRLPLKPLPPDDAARELGGVAVSGVASMWRCRPFARSEPLPEDPGLSGCSAGLFKEVLVAPWYVACFLLLSQLAAHIGRAPKKTPPPAVFMLGLVMRASCSSNKVDKEGAEEEEPRVILKAPALLAMPAPPKVKPFFGLAARVAKCRGVHKLWLALNCLSCPSVIEVAQIPSCPHPSFMQFGI